MHLTSHQTDRAIGAILGAQLKHLTAHRTIYFQRRHEEILAGNPPET